MKLGITNILVQELVQSDDEGTILGSSILAFQMGKSASEYAQRQFSNDITISNTMKVYELIVFSNLNEM